ncbi:MAG TPA: ATP-dependent helicase HrpB [Gemmatimonadaceae bacterium]|nr:ATP-dependent helicase HrpB [Gemmatimonadaceae bacterium]
MDPALPPLREALTSHSSAVLQAPPGAGKTTRVPLALVEEPWLQGSRVVMLEPRRLATRAAAHRLAEQLGERVGAHVGYRMRGESRAGPNTRIEVVTEGLLTRRLQRDPILDGIGLVIFDEFHERSLDADVGLALALRTQQLLRPELRILVMSATLDGEAVAGLLGGAPIVTSEGRGYPVETIYRPPRAQAPLESSVVATILESLGATDGDVLVFLPGAGEIRRVEAQLHDRNLGGAIVTPLFGALAPDAQDRAIVPDPAGRRKIVLATSIAETSLTIEGITVVIDAGLSRVPRFSPRSGMTRLATVRVSRASADQRRGRAGRIAPGVCYRLWSEHETAGFLASTPPEITSADLAPLALDLAAAGVASPDELAWLDPPPPAAFAHARELLRELEALDMDGAVTETGRAMAALPVHPRLSHMLIRARMRGMARLACDVAALLGERDLFRGGPAPLDADVVLRLEAIRGARTRLMDAEVDRDALRRVRAEADRLARQLHVDTRDAHDAPPLDAAGALLALAYPDRVARRRPGERARYVLRNGRGAELTGAQGLARAPYIVAAELDDARPESRVFLAAALSEADVLETFASQIVETDVIAFDPRSDSIRAHREERLGAIVLREAPLREPDEGVIRRALLDTIRARGLDALPWSDGARRLRARMAFVAHHDPSWPRVSDEALLESLASWLGPRLDGVRRWSDLARIDLADALAGLLTWQQRRALESLAPTHIEVPSGSRIPVDYADPDAPALAVRLQEVFGLVESPRVLDGRVPITMQLLSPASRPVQVTRDLAGFWRTSYFDVRKDLRGRYPKHEWPEDPLHAAPTRRAKPRPK